MANQRVRTSKFISLVLRHRPKMIGLVLDVGGWVPVDALLAGMNARGMPIDLAVLEQVVAENGVWMVAHVPSEYIRPESSEALTGLERGD